MYEDNKGFLNISYSLGDNRSYVCKLHSKVVKTSLYDKNNINMHMNYNINTNYYLELLRTLRILNKLSPKNYNIMVNAPLNKSDTKKKTKKRNKKKNKRNTRRNTRRKNL